MDQLRQHAPRRTSGPLSRHSRASLKEALGDKPTTTDVGRNYRKRRSPPLPPGATEGCPPGQKGGRRPHERAEEASASGPLGRRGAGKVAVRPTPERRTTQRTNREKVQRGERAVKKRSAGAAARERARHPAQLERHGEADEHIAAVAGASQTAQAGTEARMLRPEGCGQHAARRQLECGAEDAEEEGDAGGKEDGKHEDDEDEDGEVEKGASVFNRSSRLAPDLQRSPQHSAQVASAPGWGPRPMEISKRSPGHCPPGKGLSHKVPVRLGKTSQFGRTLPESG